DACNGPARGLRIGNDRRGLCRSPSDQPGISARRGGRGSLRRWAGTWVGASGLPPPSLHLVGLTCCLGGGAGFERTPSPQSATSGGRNRPHTLHTREVPGSIPGAPTSLPWPRPDFVR